MNPYLHRFLGNVLRPLARFWGRRRLSNHSGTIRIPGLSHPVEIRRDAQGVPHIIAQTQKDAFMAQGYVHCQDRLWQMEVNRRLALGRISEVFGKVALDTDKMARTFGFGRLGFEDMNLITPEMHAYIQAYCDGVNACIVQMGRKLPVEFSLARYKPEPWTVQHVLAFTRLMTFQLAYGWGHELARWQMIQALGPELAAELDTRYHPEHPITLPEGLKFNELTAEGILKAFEGPFFKHITGSNAWAVSGNRTDTGKPYLCSDPHLAMLMPSIWYQVYMEAADYRAQGVSIPGMPLVMIGHNAKISWGITLSFTDIQDLFVEQFQDEDSNRYRFKEDWLEAETHMEKIKVKGVAEPVEQKVQFTRHGVVISDALDLPYRDANTHKLTLQSPALSPSGLLFGWYGLNQSQGWNDFVAALDQIEAPGLNVVYADVEGNIGYRMTGNTPIRAVGQGEVPQPGWDGLHEWVGQVPKSEMPSTLNPESGVVISANHKVVPEDYPYFMGNIWMNGYRADRIKELLHSKPKWALEDFKAIQMDLLCKPGLEFARHCALLKGSTLLSPTSQKALETLLEWNGVLALESIGGSIYQVARLRAVELLIESASKDPDSRPWMLGKGMQPLLFKVSEFQGKDTEALLALLNQPESRLLELAGGKERLLATAMNRAVQWLEKEWGPSMENWKWGSLHQMEFPHPMAVQKPLDRVFNVGPFPMAGDTDTVCQTSMLPHEPFAANLALPSYRQIVDLSDFNQSLWVLPPGQSGQIGSQHYQDQVDAWRNGRYFPMLWDRDKIKAATMKLLTLNPI